MAKYGALYEDLDNSRSSALFYGPAMLFIRFLFVMNVFLGTEGPLLQIFLSFIILSISTFLAIHIRPYEERSQNNLEIFFNFIVMILAGSCIAFIPEIREDYPLRLNAQHLFIYGFMGMMAISVAHLIFTEVKNMLEKRKKKL